MDTHNLPTDQPTPGDADRVEDVPLFDGYEPRHPATDEPADKLSAGGRLRLRQQTDVSNGRHPLTRGPLHPEASRDRTAADGKRDPFTCGSCRHREPSEGRHSWPKCVLPDPTTGRATRITNGPATDVRAWWPACPAYEAQEGRA